MRYFYLLASLLSFPILAVQAQADSTAIRPAAPECGPLQPAQLCVDFDARRSVDAGAGELVYRWNMGDGRIETGLAITHCYTTRARYQVTLDVLVPATGEVRRAERTFPVDLTTRPVLNFSIGPAATARVGQPVVFDALDSVLPGCQSVATVWDFRDGFTQQGQRVEHAFRKPGRFQVRMSLRGFGGGSCGESNCVSQEVVITP
ncbi:MAG: PKD domain-containing protein [Hymenobacter sp.]|nr:MAG: PKD domain-containing protein [Hymenobacter sp.]